jgi:AraC-like DNA-binding protein
VVLDHEGRIIYAQNPAMKTISDLIISSIDLSPENSQPVRRAIHRVGREDYFLYLRTSEDKQLTYLSIIPYRQFARAVQKYTMIFFVMVIFIILIGSLLIFFLMKYNYEPLKKLVQYSRKYAGLPPEQHAGIHDIEIIRAALDEITDKNESLAHHIDRIMNFLDLQIEEAATPSGGREGLKTEQRITVSHDSILKYIEENYQKKDFCVQSIADHFGLSFSNLSHQFKNYTGKNISSFISALKLNYAKKLLSTTSLPVSEIALRLGYSQASGFIRKFRQTEGISPGEYRNRKPDEALKD